MKRIRNWLKSNMYAYLYEADLSPIETWLAHAYCNYSIRKRVRKTTTL